MSAVTDLRAYVQVVERGGFAAASEGLGLTPSAVAKLVTRLEDRLGVRLLHRTTRRVSLTPEGEIYHLRARDILAAIDDADAEVSQAGQQPRGRLRVNCVPAFAFHQLMPALPEFLTRCPEVELDFHRYRPSRRPIGRERRCWNTHWAHSGRVACGTQDR